MGKKLNQIWTNTPKYFKTIFLSSPFNMHLSDSLDWPGRGSCYFSSPRDRQCEAVYEPAADGWLGNNTVVNGNGLSPYRFHVTMQSNHPLIMYTWPNIFNYVYMQYNHILFTIGIFCMQLKKN